MGVSQSWYSQFTATRRPFGTSAGATVGFGQFLVGGAVGKVFEDESDAVWLSATDYLAPSTLALAEVGAAPDRALAETFLRSRLYSTKVRCNTSKLWTVLLA